MAKVLVIRKDNRIRQVAYINGSACIDWLGAAVGVYELTIYLTSNEDISMSIRIPECQIELVTEWLSDPSRIKLEINF